PRSASRAGGPPPVLPACSPASLRLAGRRASAATGAGNTAPMPGPNAGPRCPPSPSPPAGGLSPAVRPSLALLSLRLLVKRQQNINSLPHFLRVFHRHRLSPPPPAVVPPQNLRRLRFRHTA